ncbi:MAG: VTT domain-containing protein [Sandaracinaceae bacterium]|nr:VTT domain-containing protein [Sandaracinaceae bacterium]
MTSLEPTSASPTSTSSTSTSSTGPSSASPEPVKIEVGPAPTPPKPAWPRLVGLVVLMAILFAIGHVTGLTHYLTREHLRALMEGLGAWGVLLFIVLFAVGEFLHVPGIVFVLAALLAYGRIGGAFAAYAGALASVSFSFLLVRRVGGQALAHVKRARIAKILEHLDRHPIPTIAVLRTFLFLLPAVNYALAMTRVRFRDYLVGSAIGLVVPMIVVAIAFEWALAFFA